MPSREPQIRWSKENQMHLAQRHGVSVRYPNSNHHLPSTIRVKIEAIEEHRRAVWNKGRAVPGHSPDAWRHDALGNLMQYAAYDNPKAVFGWRISYAVPPSGGNGDNLANLQPLHRRACDCH